MRTIFKEEKRFDEVLKVRKAKLKGLGECTVDHALWHNCVEILQ